MQPDHTRVWDSKLGLTYSDDDDDDDDDGGDELYSCVDLFS